MDGVNIPIKKPDSANVEFKDGSLIINNMNYEQISSYVNQLENDGYKVIDNLKHVEEKYSRLMIYKDDLVITFRVCDRETSISVLTGNVKEGRNVSIENVRQMLGEEYSECIFFEIENESVANEGYCEFLLIPYEYYDMLKQDDYSTYYVLADEEGILLCEKDVWNMVYPMSVNLYSDTDGTSLVINANDTPGTRSSWGVYPRCLIYNLKDGVFEKEEENYWYMGRVTIAKLENGVLKYYNLKENEKFDIKNGVKTLWIIDEEYIPK